MNWSRKSNRGSPQCGAFAAGRRARRRRNDAGFVSLCLGGGSPAAPRIALSAYRFSRQRGSLCAPVFRRKRDVRFAPPYVKRYTVPTYSPPAREASHACFALRAAVRRGKRGTVGLQSAKDCFAAAVNPFSLRVPLFARAAICSRAGTLARLLIGRGGAFALCRIRGGVRDSFGQRQALRFA